MSSPGRVTSVFRRMALFVRSFFCTLTGPDRLLPLILFVVAARSESVSRGHFKEGHAYPHVTTFRLHGRSRSERRRGQQRLISPRRPQFSGFCGASAANAGHSDMKRCVRGELQLGKCSTQQQETAINHVRCAQRECSEHELQLPDLRELWLLATRPAAPWSAPR